MAKPVRTGRNATLPDLSARDAFRILRQELTAASDDTIPRGFRTAMQWSTEVRLSRQQAAKILNDAVTAGRAEVRKFRLNGHQIPHYRLIEAKGRK